METLRNGSRGESVKLLQKHLKLTEDGVFGNGTEAAVKKWQSDNNLTPDGVVGPKGWEVLLSKTESKPSAPNSTFYAPLKGHIPDKVFNELPMVVEKFNINTPLRMAHFLAQCAHESGNFKHVTENLNYSAQGLKTTFAKYFPGNLSELYERNPQKIANRVYANRMGNGPEASAEGFKFRGQGFLQLTGKDNFLLFNHFVPENVLDNPQLVAEKYPLLSAGWFFHVNNLNTISDRGKGDDVVTLVTRRVNGGTNGLQDRIKHFKEYMNLLEGGKKLLV